MGSFCLRICIRCYNAAMNKNIIIWIVCIIVVLVAGFFIYKSMSGSPAASTDTGVAPATDTATATSSATQVQAQEVKIGTGAVAAPGTQASVLYVGQLEDGTVFDSSAAHNNVEYTFV